MKILIVTYYFPPLSSIASLRPYYFAKSLMEIGHDVTVLTADKPSQGHRLDLSCDGLRVISAQSNLLNVLYRQRNVALSQSSTSALRRAIAEIARRANQLRIRRGLSFLGRMPDVLDLLIRPSLAAVADRTWDVVISTYSPYYCHTVAHRMKRRGQCSRWIADFRDLWTRNHNFGGLFPFTLLEKELESKYLAFADVITTVSDDLAAHLEQISGKQVRVINNTFDDVQLKNIPKNSYFTDEKVRLVYTGTTYPNNPNYTVLLDAVRLCKQRDPALSTRLQVVFAGADLGHVRNQVLRRNLDDIIMFLGSVSREDALRIQRDGHVLLFFETEGQPGITTGKLFEYLKSGTLIWRVGHASSTEALNILTETATGIDAGCNPSLIAEWIASLVRSPVKPRVESDYHMLKRYDRSGMVRRLRDVLEFS